MTSDLPGEPGALDPGLDRLFRTLTAPATPDERAGEQDALAMFRANVRPPASTVPASTVPASTVPAAPCLPHGACQCSACQCGAAGRARPPPARSVPRSAGASGWPPPRRWPSAAPPRPLTQRPCRRLYSTSRMPFSGSPACPTTAEAPLRARTGITTTPARPPAPRRRLRPRSTPAPTASKSPSASPSATASATPTASVAAGPTLLSAVAASTEITSASDAIIDGRLTRSGKVVPGIAVTLYRAAGGAAELASGRHRTDKCGRERGHPGRRPRHERGVPAEDPRRSRRARPCGSSSSRPSMRSSTPAPTPRSGRAGGQHAVRAPRERRGAPGPVRRQAPGFTCDPSG